MKRVFFFMALSAVTAGIHAGQEAGDSTRVYDLGEVVIASTRVAADAPMTVSLMDGGTLQNSSTGTAELPFLMQLTPSVIASSDNGTGIGTSYMSIRGTRDERINFTMDGVPLNNPEDQTVFWANMNSYSASVSSIQIQRGAGTSTNGTGAFGASVSMESDAPSPDRHLNLETSAGTYGTYAGTVKAGTGLIKGHLTLDGRFSYTCTDGYIERTGANLGSYFAQAAWSGDNAVIRLKNFGGYEHTGQAWNGVPAEQVMAGNRTYNSLGLYHDDSGMPAERPTTDNYNQNITHLSIAGRLNGHWNAGLTLSLNIEEGYYEDMKDSVDLAAKFGLNGYGTASADRHKWVRNRQVGAFGTAVRTSESCELTFGAGGMWYVSDHWGNLEWIQGQHIASPVRYYFSDAGKNDANVSAKAMFHLSERMHLFADLQLRHTSYRIGGQNDKFTKGTDGTYRNQLLDVNEKFTFINPKAGISWDSRAGNLYLSFARTGREPTRNNYTDNGGTLKPRHESMNDIEAGWSKAGNGWHAGISLYHMGYRDQLIPTGRLSDIGEALTENVDRSLRSGIELQGGLQPARWFTWELNATLSRNLILDFTEYVDNWDGEALQIHYDRTDIALSPSLTASSLMTFDAARGLEFSLLTHYTGRQYLDNSSCRDRSLDPYCVTDISVRYSYGRMGLTARAGNVTGTRYATGGWVYSAVSESCGYTADRRYTESGLAVQAPHTFILTISFDL